MAFFTTGLTEKQIDILHRMGAWTLQRSFYLAGGTALSIYFGHRASEDLDWFTMQVIANPLNLAQTMRTEGIDLITESFAEGTLHGSIHEVRMSFMSYPYALLQPPFIWTEMNCALASLDDIACMKLVAVAQRGTKKDFIDLYILLQCYKSLSELLDLYRQKYASENITPVLIGLVYFDDAELDPLPLKWDVPWNDVKNYLQKSVCQIK
ncbi:MAG: nucleotidyl transferase AbiEii/AbiGii toxin family protein [Chloroflexota bacterium]|jgi:predicted nucleotidyltransferase component of viral defense system